MPRDGLQNGTNGRRLHERRRAAAKENTADLTALGHRRLMGHFARKSRDILRFIDGGVADMRVEVAIGAF